MRQPRTFAALRGEVVGDQARADEDTIDKVLGRIGGDRDGRLLVAWLKAECQTLAAGSSDAALREAEGQRRGFGRLIEMLTAI